MTWNVHLKFARKYWKKCPLKGWKNIILFVETGIEQKKEKQQLQQQQQFKISALKCFFFSSSDTFQAMFFFQQFFSGEKIKLYEKILEK